MEKSSMERDSCTELGMNPTFQKGFSDEQIEAMSMHLTEPPIFTVYEFIFTVVTIGLYIVDTGVGVYLAWEYYTSGYITYFGLTLGFVIIPSVLATGFSALLHISDSQNSRLPKPSLFQRGLRWIFSFLQIGPIFRDLNVLKYGMQSVLALRKFDSSAQERYYDFMLVEQSDSAFIRLFQRFLQGGPQVTLQMYVIFHHLGDPNTDFGGIVQLTSISTSLTCMAWSLAVFNSTSRTTVPGKKRLSICGKILQFLWHLCMISSRVVALALFASAHPTLIAPVCTLRWVFMLSWLSCQEQESSKEMEMHESGAAGFICHFCKKFIIAFLYMFALFNTDDKPRRLKYDVFYLGYFAENSILLVVCILSSMCWDVLVIAAVSNSLFIIGFLFMCVYFKWFHPSLRFPTLHSALSHWVGVKEGW